MSKRLISRLSIIVLSSLMVIQSCQTPSNITTELKTKKSFNVKAISGSVSITPSFFTINPNGSCSIVFDPNTNKYKLNYKLEYSAIRDMYFSIWPKGSEGENFNSSGTIELTEVSGEYIGESNERIYARRFFDYDGGNCRCTWDSSLETNVNVKVKVILDSITKKGLVNFTMEGVGVSRGYTTGGSSWSSNESVSGNISFDNVQFEPIVSPSPTPSPTITPTPIITPTPNPTPSDEPCDCTPTNSFAIKAYPSCDKKPCPTPTPVPRDPIYTIPSPPCYSNNNPNGAFNLGTVYNNDVNGTDLTFVSSVNSSGKITTQQYSNALLGAKSELNTVFNSNGKDISIKNSSSISDMAWDNFSGVSFTNINSIETIKNKLTTQPHHSKIWEDYPLPISKQTNFQPNGSSNALFINAVNTDAIYKNLINSNGRVIPNKYEKITLNIGGENIKIKLKLNPNKKEGPFYKWEIECSN